MLMRSIPALPFLPARESIRIVVLSVMEGLYTEETLQQVLLVTGVIGGGAAWLTGRAIAHTWRPFWHLMIYTALLGGAVRFVHFALFEGTLLSPASYGADTLYLLVIAALAWRMARAAQMATQYYWLYERTSPLTWRLRDEKPAETPAMPANSG